MKLSEKIISLRKANSFSQEELAERLNVSRQAVSRWEGGTATPDAAHILQLSRLFNVSCDYLLDDELNSLPDALNGGGKARIEPRLLLIASVALEACIFIFQILFFIVMKYYVLGALSLALMALPIVAYEFLLQRAAASNPPDNAAYRRRFHIISMWIAAYFPIRITVSTVMTLYPRPYSSVAMEALCLIAYAVAGFAASRAISRHFLN